MALFYKPGKAELKSTNEQLFKLKQLLDIEMEVLN